MVPLDSDTVPCVSAVADTLVTVSTCTFSFAGPALSFVVRSDAANTRFVSSSVLFASSVADGVSLTVMTVTLTVPVVHFESGEPLVVPLSQTW